MRTVEIIGFNRANLGKQESKRLREAGNVPCVVYGDGGQIHFYAPVIMFRELVYTHKAHFVNLNVEGKELRCILQDIQFHPVSEMILHADFLELHTEKQVKMKIPVTFTGSAVGMLKGGKLEVKQQALWVKALPKDIPEVISVDITNLDLGKSVKVGELDAEDFEFLNLDRVTIASVNIPRVAKMAEEEELAALAAEEGAEEGAVEGAEEDAESTEKEPPSGSEEKPAEE